MDDLISRQAAIDAVGYYSLHSGDKLLFADKPLKELPSATPTLYGYPIEHLAMIARVMAKENCTPEDVARLLQNAGEIAKMVRDEMMEMLKESIERTCKGIAND